MRRTNDPDRVGSLLALFSPRVSVKRSVNFTKHYISTGEYRHDVVRSVRAAVDHWSKTGEIRGPKTSAFRNAMLGDLNAVVLDVWMAKFFKVDQKVFGTKSGYRLFSERLCRIADALGVSPRDAQATVWVYTLRLHGRNPPMMDLSDLIEQELFT